MEKTVKTLRVLKGVGILVIIATIFCLTDYIIYRKTGESFVLFKSANVQDEGDTTENNDKIEEDKANKTDHTELKNEIDKLNEDLNKNEEEVKNALYNTETIANFLNQPENNGFILENYEEPSKMDPYYIFATSKYYVKDDAKVKQYENMTKSEVTTGLYKVSAEEAIKVFLDKTGLEFSVDDIRNMMAMSFVYLPPDDSYYTLNSDDLSAKVKCTKVEQVDDKWIASYEAEKDTGNYVKGIVTLKRNNNQDGWLFVSNEIISTNMY